MSTLVATGLVQRKTTAVQLDGDLAIYDVSPLETADGCGEEAAAQSARDSKKRMLLLYHELPAWRQDNMFIRSGYRPDSNCYWKSLASLTYLHNESVNIWSHLLGAVAYIVWGLYLYQTLAPRYTSASLGDVLACSCFFGGCVVCLSLSTVYHTLNNHSPSVAKCSNQLDYMGIICMIVGSYIPCLYYGFFHCAPISMFVHTFMICMFGVACGVVTWNEKFRQPQWRPYRAMMFSGLAFSGTWPLLEALWTDGYALLHKQYGIGYVLLEGAFYLTGATLYAIRWPERSFPGLLDLFGNSHQLLHLFVLLAAASQITAIAHAFDYRHSVLGTTCPSL